MKKILAFDIDGTLVDGEKNIQPGVLSLFKDERIKNCVVLFLTGNTITTVNRVKADLSVLVNNKNTVNSYFTTLCGSIIYDKHNNIVLERFLCRKRLKFLLEEAIKIDPDCLFMFMNKNQQVFNHITKPKIRKILEEKLDFVNMDRNEMKFDDEDFITLLPKLPRIYLTNIFSAKHANEIYEALAPFAQDAGYHIYCEPFKGMIQISANSKLRALKYMTAKLKHDKVFDGNLSDVIYFGDGANDIECLKACGFSVARGTDLENDVVENSDLYTEDLSPHLNTLLK